jgi:hypothetical protein
MPIDEDIPYRVNMQVNDCYGYVAVLAYGWVIDCLYPSNWVRDSLVSGINYIVICS